MPYERDPYAALSVHPQAPIAEIKKAYIKKVKETHPDSSNTLTADAFIAVQHAYAAILTRAERESPALLRTTEPYSVVTYTELLAGTFCRCGDVFSPSLLVGGTVECQSCSNFVEVAGGAAQT
ncbi:hypothetical protein NEDG_00117 [Nematocida displodere]|uniref:J domain-containing protein n=1 Tax=Nematocida displodere TaxID=1805483 RepID=A0A177EKJ4_9MICR|nr:hypothetical protein NEDG_00117 [Nematocida displodere]